MEIKPSLLNLTLWSLNRKTVIVLVCWPHYCISTYFLLAEDQIVKKLNVKNIKDHQKKKLRMINFDSQLIKS